MPGPTHRLVAKYKGSEHGRSIGVAWENEQGWINIKLNPCVVISHNDDVYLNLYKIKDDDRYPPPGDPPPKEDDDVPF